MSAKKSVRRSRRFVGTAVFAAAALVATVAEVNVASAEFRRKAPPVQKTRSVRGTEAGVEALPFRDATAVAAAKPTTRTAWPAAGSAVADVPARGRARAGTLPVHVAKARGRVSSPSSVRVELLAQDAAARAGIVGVPLRVRRADGGKAAAKVGLTIDYSAFANAVGGDWSSRLRVVRVPSGEPVETTNDVTAKTLTTTVDAEPEGSMSMLAVTAAAGGGAGDYSATSLSPSAQWQVNNQTGDFSWSYPFRVPPGVNGPTPAVNLNYASGSVDGRTASTNSQPSWIGEGHTMEWGYVERKYVSCSDDMGNGAINTTKTGDLCWRNDNANVVLAGHAGELVKDAASGEWRFENDDASKIEKLTGGFNAAQNGEYWKLTTTDGTQYFFGLQKRYATDTIATNATWTVPVFGNHTGEPCKNTTWATSYCTQAWRWNLAYVVDPHGNTMTYFYTPENNNYGRNNNTAISTYQRGGYLSRIEYGERKGNEHLTTAPAQVDFTVKERCVTATTSTFNCETTAMTSTNASNWPDVPFDQICSSATSCTGKTSPTFFTRKRLTQIQTKYLSGTTPTAVDTWAFTHTFPDPGDGTTKALWLASLQHTGNVGTAIALPSVTFSGIQLQNRVDGVDNAPPLIKWRVSSIMSETGAVVSVNYAAQECTPTNLPASPQTNTKRCFPVFWSPEGAIEPQMDYFHKYVVSSIVDDDRTGSSADKVAQYTYLDTPAWHYDDNELSVPKHRTYSDYRGYSKVRVTLGATGDQSVTEYLYFRGMDEDTLPGGAVRDVKIRDSENVDVEDNPRLNGVLREVRTFSGGAEVSGAIYDQWVSAATAVNGSVKAYLTGNAKTRGRVAIAGGGSRETETVTTYDGDYGMATTIEDRGDIAVATDDRCTRLTYARNTALWIVDAVSRSETVSVGCGATTNRPAHVISDARTYYDGSTTLGAAPTRGLPTKTEVLDSWTTGPVYKQKNRLVYDVNGRTLESYDALDRKTSFAYTPATTGPVTQMTETNPLLHVNTTTLHPAWGVTTAEVDANGKRTDLTYDALGRLTQAWLPGRLKTSFPASPNMKFAYLVRNNGPVAVTTQELRNDGTYTTGYALYDGLLRPRQSQQPAPGGGRVVTDTTYNSRGLVADRNGPYYNTLAPATSLFVVGDNQMPAQVRTTYDGANRPVVEAFRVNDVEKWRTTTTYAGDRTHIDPPAGTPPRTVLTDAREQVTAVREYHGASPTGTYDETTYDYWPTGMAKSITDKVGNTWSYSYDLRGRATGSVDPDKGATTTAYDDLDQVTTVTDARQETVAYKYDVLGRRTEMRDGSITGPLLAEWTYDTVTNAKGKAASSTRWVGTDAYKTEITAYDDAYRPTSSRVVIPAVEGTLAGTYTTGLTYNVDGTVKTIAQPTTPGLPAETLTLGYDDLGLADTLVGYGTYVANTTYSPYGEVLQLSLGSTVGKASWQTFFYEEGTRRLEESLLDREIVPTSDSHVFYTYDPTGNVQKIKDTAASGTPDTQCFTYDNLRRLTEAWSANDDCAAAPSLSVLGGVAPYWNSYTYDSTGNRLTDVRHDAAGDTTRTYSYPAAGQPRPHGLTSVTTAGPSGTTTDTYGYDVTGNLDARTVGGSSDTLTWDAEGNLEKVTTPQGETSFVYDANGGRLLRRDPQAVTLYLDNTEIRLDRSTNVARGTRYYTHNGKTIAVRQGTDVETLATDHHGTANFSIDNATGGLTKRRFDPFGLPRDAAGTWVGERSFVGGTADPSTKLVHLGAREYDPVNGRFISVDPLIDPNDPQQMNGYAYSNNNPVSLSDPDGLMVASDGGGGGGKSSGGGGTTTSTSQTQKPYGPPHQAMAWEHLHDNQKPLTERDHAQIAVDVARGRQQHAKNKMKEAVGALVKIAADELGITAAVNCITEGDGGSCGEMALNIVMSFAGGIAGKLLKKYGMPWKWKKAAKLVGRIWNLAGEAIDALRGFFKYGDEVRDAMKHADEVFKRTDEAAAKADEALSCPRNSFTADTPVLLYDGSTKRIGDIDVGDLVLATDPVRGITAARAVTGLIVNGGLHTMVDVALSDGTAITTTDRHPFWSVGDERFVFAADLLPGAVVRTVRGTHLRVESTRVYEADVVAHNLTVDEIHTYYAGSTPVLVHNCEPLPTQKTRGKTQELTPSQAEDLANYLGHKKTGHTVKNQPVFKKGRSFIVQDLDSHNGGTWKMANSPGALKSKHSRVATTDALLTPIGK